MRMRTQRSTLDGSLKAPPSKSYTHRALFCSALAHGESTLHSPLLCEDTRATSDALSRVGVTIKWHSQSAHVLGDGVLKQPQTIIHCGESGTTLRFMTAACATTPYGAEISGGPSLLKRPVGDLAHALEELGAECVSMAGFPPVRVRGPIRGGAVTLPGNVSSQYVSALLLAAPLAEEKVEINVSGPLESKYYVDMTLDMQQVFGVRIDATDDLTEFQASGQAYIPSEVSVEGDWSSAACLLAAAAIAGNKVTVNGLNVRSRQADRSVLGVFQRMGARVRCDSESTTVERSQIVSVEIDVSNCPDLFPVICALCATAAGTSRITGIRRLRIKESNRVQAMSEGLKEMGIQTSETEDSYVVHGGKAHKAIVDPHRDHRIAMAFAVLGLSVGDVTIVDAECVGKSYPSFWPDLKSLGAKVTPT